MLIKVDSTELFTIAHRLIRFAQDKVTEGTTAMMCDDYSTYMQARQDFDDIKRILNTGALMEWSIVQETVVSRFPAYQPYPKDAECLSMVAQTQYEPFNEEQTAIDDEIDVPF